MRILFLTYHFPTPEESGAGRPWSTASLLRDLGHEPVVVTAGTHYLTGEDIRRDRTGLTSEENIGGFSVIKTYAPRDYRRSTARRLLNYLAFAAGAMLAGLRQRDIDAVLVAMDPIFITPVAYLLSLLKRAPLILDERDVYPDTAVALGMLKSPVIIGILDRWHRFMCGKSPAILAATPGIKRILLGKGVEGEKVFVLPNVRVTSPLADGSRIQEEIRERHGWRSRFLVMYAGNFGQANDMFTILKAAKLLSASCPGIHIALIGAGEKKAQYVSFCKEEGLQNIEFLAAVPWLELQGYLAAADVTVHAFPDQPFWDCTLASKILDYMWAAKPVVFSGRGDTADLLGVSGGGVATRPGDPQAFCEAIARLSQSPSTAKDMGEKGYRHMVEHFSMDRLRETMRMALAPLATANRSAPGALTDSTIT
jgi:glycosyltransferase involved in cell wall biosynthesis